MIKKKKQASDYSQGFVMGQRKLCSAILEMTLGSVADYLWLLAHLKEVSEGREVLDNSSVGFTNNDITN